MANASRSSEHLPPGTIVARYLIHNARLAELGAKLRANGRKDNTWTEQESKEWDDICDAIDAPYYNLTAVELKLLDMTIEPMMAAITNGKWIEYVEKMKVLL